MDQSSYKDFATSRGINYHYFFSQPTGDKPYLLLLHGFPSTSRDWLGQVEFFKNEGYGLIVPDMLGYGGTSKPTDPMEYRHSLVAKDFVELLDNEKVDKVVSIGHDWGSGLNARVANFYPERFLGFGYLAIGYRAPTLEPPFLTYEALNNLGKKLAGYELFGYWAFFSEEGADKIIEEHIDSFMSLLFAEDPTLQKENLCATGGLKKWLLEDKTAKIASYVSEKEYNLHKETLLKGGLAGPLCYYRAATSTIQVEDASQVKKENINIPKPVFFGGAKRDPVGIIHLQKNGFTDTCADFTFEEFDTAHWVMMEGKDALNKALLAWLQKKF